MPNPLRYTLYKSKTLNYNTSHVYSTKYNMIHYKNAYMHTHVNLMKYLIAKSHTK